MRRHIQPEILDELAVDDPRAIQSRRDLQKVNAFMGHTGMVTRALRAPSTPRAFLSSSARATARSCCESPGGSDVRPACARCSSIAARL